VHQIRFVLLVENIVWLFKDKLIMNKGCFLKNERKDENIFTLPSFLILKKF